MTSRRRSVISNFLVNVRMRYDHHTTARNAGLGRLAGYNVLPYAVRLLGTPRKALFTVQRLTARQYDVHLQDTIQDPLQ
jgi:hypothetical protein